VDLLLYVFDLLVFIGIFGMYSLSLNLETGFTGLANFGKVAFILIGAYTYAILSHLGVPFYLCLIAGAIVAALAGLLVSLPTLRLRADYLGIAILAFGEILRTIVRAEKQIAGGVWGITVPPAISIANTPPRIDALINIGLVYFCLAICFVIVQRITNSPYGRTLRAIREDEIAADALGKNRTRYKAQVLMIGSAIAGIGGGLYAQYIQFIDPTMFLPLITFLVWMMVLLGGPGNNWGMLVGAGLVQIFDRGSVLLKDILPLPIDPLDLQYILFGALVIIILIYRPFGIFRESQVKTKALEIARSWKKKS